MSANRNWGTILNAPATLTPGAPSATLIAAPAAGTSAYVTSLTITTSDTTQRLVTITDGTMTIKAYVSATAPLATLWRSPVKFKTSTAVSVSVPALTAASTLECLAVGFYSMT